LWNEQKPGEAELLKTPKTKDPFEGEKPMTIPKTQKR
jgi:hypothetical protein